LNILCKIWKKETDDLFDFETNDIEETELKIKEFNSKFYLLSNGDKINLINSFDSLMDKYRENQIKTKEKNENNFLIITEFSFSSSSFFRICNPILSHDLRKKITDTSCLSRSWRLSKKNEENLIGIGDIIKLGRVRLKIETICFKDIYESCQISNNLVKNKNKLKYGTTLNQNNLNLNKINNIMNTNINNSQNESILEEERVNNLEKNKKDKKKLTNLDDISINSDKNSVSKPLCRICYITSSDMENPLISPCKCNGTMKYIHYKCLKHCIEVNLTKKIEQNYKYYNWKNYSCEICKEEYPKYIKIKDSLYPLVDLEISFSSYITCDYALYDDVRKKTSRKGILIIKINEDSDEDIITLGRSQNNRVKLKDISVSRNHCNIIKRKNQLFIVDKGSKFGSLIYINNPLSINKKNDEEIIISGRHWFSIKLEEETNFFSKLFFSAKCCQCNEIKQNSDVDIEHLDENNDSHQPEKIYSIINKNNYIIKDLERQILDNSYQDYILDLGDDIYLHEQSESEEIK